MAQFAPIYSLFLFFYVWFVFLFLFCSLWWISKRPYSFLS
uniref:ATP synthase F0 subunit 8 n=1 Tax=Meretrix lusoria TaxID=74491 RepID=E5D136_MERLU|nr:ATP synthase F0 subunit 8 [Meretrix lusoria]ADC36214.1 ATP synthase F0 subunit 8 [Meretrix lusoria]